MTTSLSSFYPLYHLINSLKLHPLITISLKMEDLPECLLNYLSVDDMLLLRTVSMRLLSVFNLQDTLDIICNTHSITIKCESFWDFVFFYRCYHSINNLYRNGEELNILLARTGEEFGCYNNAFLVGCEHNNPHIINTTEYKYYTGALTDNQSQRLIWLLPYAPHFDTAKRLVATQDTNRNGTPNWGQLYIGRVYRNDLEGVKWIISRYEIDINSYHNAEYGRCSIKTIEYLLTTLHFIKNRSMIRIVLLSAVSHNNRELIAHMFNKHRSEFGDNHPSALSSAITTLDIALVCFVLNLYKSDIEWDRVLCDIARPKSTLAHYRLLFSLPQFHHNQYLVITVATSGCSDVLVKRVLAIIPKRITIDWDYEHIPIGMCESAR